MAKEWDVTTCADSLCCCGMIKTTLTIEDEKLLYKTTNCFGEQKRSINYGELGAVDVGQCCCFYALNTNIGPIQPGFGCDEALVKEIYGALKEKCNLKGDIATRKTAEDSFEMTRQLNEKVDLLLKHHNITYHPVSTVANPLL